MKIAYLECFAGIAGDMFLGALVDAGVTPARLQEAADSLKLGVQLEFKKVDRSGIQATKARVLLHGVEADAADAGHQSGAAGSHHHEDHEVHTHRHAHTDEHGHTHTHSHAHTHSDAHAEDGSHAHGRSLSEIRHLIGHATLTPHARAIALLAFERLGAAEAKIHGVPIESVHFHEVGAVDAIIDIVCGAAGADALGVDAWFCSPVNTGSGFVDCAHGRFPVPAPATLELLQGVPVYAEGPAKEMTTPTGAALVNALGCRFEAVALTGEHLGYGAGTRNPERFPNVLRLRVGVKQAMQPAERANGSLGDSVTVLACSIDDATPEVLAAAAGLLMEHGALDVLQQPVAMKKGRLGTALTVVCRPDDARAMEHLLFRHTSTLGVRRHEEQRTILVRSSVAVTTEFGDVRIKLGSIAGEVVNAAPEYEDCAKAARSHKVPLKQVMQQALAAYYALPRGAAEIAAGAAEVAGATR